MVRFNAFIDANEERMALLLQMLSEKANDSSDEALPAPQRGYKAQGVIMGPEFVAGLVVLRDHLVCNQDFLVRYMKSLEDLPNGMTHLQVCV